MTLFLIVKYYPLSKSKQTLLGLQRGATWRKIIPYKFYELYFGHLSIYRRMIEGEINFTTYYLSFLFVDFLIFFFFSCVVMSSFRKCCSFCINKKEQCYSNGFICVHIDWRIDLYCINRLFSHKQAQDCAHTEKFGWISLSLESSSFVPFDGFASPGMFSIVLCKVLAWNCLKSYAYFRLCIFHFELLVKYFCMLIAY